MTDQQLKAQWQRIKDECPTFWKEPKKEAAALKNFCNQFGRFEYENFVRAIDYIIKHLIRNAYDWPVTSQIMGAINLTHKPKEFKPTGSYTKDTEGFKGFVKTLAEIEVKPAYDREEPDTKNVKSMSEVMHQLFQDQYLNPALSYERGRRFNTKREDMTIEDLEKDNCCWYCGAKTYRPRDKQAEGMVIQDFFECPKCKVNGRPLQYR